MARRRATGPFSEPAFRSIGSVPARVGRRANRGNVLRKILLGAIGAFCFLAAPAQAALDGTSIAVDYRFPELATVYPFASPSVSPFLVGPGVESVINVEEVTFIGVDFTDLGLTLTFTTVLDAPTWNMVPFNGLVFTGSGFGDLVGARLLPGTSFGSGSFTQDRITLAGNQLRLNWAGVPYGNGQQLHIAFAVPEPATWALLIAGFGAVGIAVRRRHPTASA